MKHIIALVGILLVAFIPAISGAQGFPAGAGFASLGLPSLGGLFSGGCAPGCDPKAGGGLAFNIGYLATNRSVALNFEAETLAISGNLVQFRRLYGLEGVWLAASATGQIGDGVGAFARGSWLIPSNRQSAEEYNGGAAQRYWTTRIQWYNADIAGTYSPYGALAAIGGFRFDSFATNFNMVSDTGNIAPSAATDDADVTVTSYIPYVGVLLSQGSAVRMGFIGFPYVPGSVKYNQTFGGQIRLEATGALRTSYFLEAFGEYGRDLMGGSLGVFGIWTYLHGRSDLDFSALQFGSPTLERQVSFSVDRQNWIFGAKFALNFASPI